jgi:hypothetical protein
MVGGMLSQAPVADEFCRQSIIERVGVDRQRAASAAAANSIRFILLSGPLSR